MRFKKNLTLRPLFHAVLLLTVLSLSLVNLAHATPALIDGADQKPAAAAGPPPDLIIGGLTARMSHLSVWLRTHSSPL